MTFSFVLSNLIGNLYFFYLFLFIPFNSLWGKVFFLLKAERPSRSSSLLIVFFIFWPIGSLFVYYPDCSSYTHYLVVASSSLFVLLLALIWSVLSWGVGTIFIVCSLSTLFLSSEAPSCSNLDLRHEFTVIFYFSFSLLDAVCVFSSDSNNFVRIVLPILAPLKYF